MGAELGGLRGLFIEFLGRGGGMMAEALVGLGLTNTGNFGILRLSVPQEYFLNHVLAGVLHVRYAWSCRHMQSCFEYCSLRMPIQTLQIQD